MAIWSHCVGMGFETDFLDFIEIFLKVLKLPTKRAKVLSRLPKPDNDNVQADDEIIQSQDRSDFF